MKSNALIEKGFLSMDHIMRTAIPSPDGAKRNPGFAAQTPDCASLHPGYETADYSLMKCSR
jgi:hypothetical protein